MLGGDEHLRVRGVLVDQVLDRLGDLEDLIDAHAALVAFAVALLAAGAVEEVHFAERQAVFEEAVALEQFDQVRVPPGRTTSATERHLHHTAGHIKSHGAVGRGFRRLGTCRGE